MRCSLVVALAAFLLSALPAHACTCVGRASAREAARTAAVVFAGRVTATRVVVDPKFGRQLEATFIVERRWKGDTDSVVVVRTMPPGGPCAFPFQAGNTYLVYATRELPGTAPETSICARTARLSHALADLAALGAGTPVGAPWDQPTAPAPAPRARSAPRDSRVTAPDGA